MDVIYIGSSNAYAHFNTVLAYHEYGFKTGMLSSDGQPFSAVEYLMKEGSIYQNPKVYIVDITCLINEIENFNEGDIRKVTDNMKNLLNRKNAIDNMVKYIDVKKEDYVNYYFSFLTYHNSWKYIGDYSFENKDLYKGHLFNENTIVVNPQESYTWIFDKGEISSGNLEIYTKLIEYIKENEINVIFVIPPRVFSYDNMKILNTATEIANKNNIEVKNFNLLDDFQIDFQNDLYNAGHINIYGSTKFTLYFGNYLNNKYHFANVKSESWDNEYERYTNTVSNLLGISYDEFFKNF